MYSLGDQTLEKEYGESSISHTRGLWCSDRGGYLPEDLEQCLSSLGNDMSADPSVGISDVQ